MTMLGRLHNILSLLWEASVRIYIDILQTFQKMVKQLKL